MSRRPREPWPWILAALLVAMMGGSLGFLWIAISAPDPPDVDGVYETGLEYSERVRDAGPADDPGGGAQ